MGPLAWPVAAVALLHAPIWLFRQHWPFGWWRCLRATWCVRPLTSCSCTATCGPPSRPLYMDTDSYNMSLDGESLHDFLWPERLLWALSWVVPQRGLRCAQGRVCGHDYTPGALRLVPSAAMLGAVSCMMKRHQRQRVVQWWHGGSL